MAGRVMSEGEIRVTPWDRFRHWLRGLFAADVRQMSAAESRLASELAQARYAVAVREDEAKALQLQIDKLTSRLKVKDVEVVALTEVIERDRLRVEAETAAFARQVADCGGRPK